MILGPVARIPARHRSLYVKRRQEDETNQCCQSRQLAGGDAPRVCFGQLTNHLAYHCHIIIASHWFKRHRPDWH